MAEIEANLGKLRRARDISAIELAKSVGVSRQTIYAMEAGTFVPNTAVALRLARALDVTVEELFSLPEDSRRPTPPSQLAVLLPGSAAIRAGQAVQLCRVNKRLIASASNAGSWYFPAADGVANGMDAPLGKTRVQAFQRDEGFANRILVAGCDPGISVLSRHLNVANVEVVMAQRNSSQALALLKDGSVHVAGTHLRDEASGECNLPQIQRLFPKHSVAVISFSVWEQGLVTAPGNPKNIRGVADLARKEISIVNRETGAGSRVLLDSLLKGARMESRGVRGYETSAPGHIQAASQVMAGAVDCCISIRAVARMFSLGFVPLASERYDFVIRKEHLHLSHMQAFLDTLSRADFRRELEGLGGYETRVTGQRVL